MTTTTITAPNAPTAPTTYTPTTTAYVQGDWTVDLDPDGAIGWYVEHTPSREIIPGFQTRTDAINYAGSPAAVELVRANAQLVIDRAGNNGGHMVQRRTNPITHAPIVHHVLFGEPRAKALAAVARAKATLAGLAGLTYVNGDPETRCTCRGWLRMVAGVWRHVDVCDDCRWVGGIASPCPASQDGHRICSDPGPIICQHAGCSVPTTVERECGRGRDACCGQCVCGDE